MDADRRDSPEPGGDDRALLWVLFAGGAVRVIVAIALGGAWGAEPTVAGILTLIAGWHLARTYLAGAGRRRAQRRSTAGYPASRA